MLIDLSLGHDYDGHGYDTHIISHIFLIFYSLWIYKNNSRYDRYPFVPISYHIYFSYFTRYGSIKTVARMIDIRLSETQRQENQCSSAKSSQLDTENIPVI